MTTTKRKSHTLNISFDPIGQDRLAYAKMALASILEGAKVSQSTILRIALKRYIQHLEHVLGDKPRLAQAEAHAVHHHQSDRSASWEGNLPADEFHGEGEFPRFSALEKKYQALKPKLADVLAAQVATMEAREARFARRGG
jgi:hypothetical protein